MEESRINKLKNPVYAEDYQDELRRCALCGRLHPKDEMERCQIDEPGAWDWVCQACMERNAEREDS